MTEKIALFGANSTIAQDFLNRLSQESGSVIVDLYARKTAKFDPLIATLVENSENYNIYPYERFSNRIEYDSVINFIGLGSPTKVRSKAREMYLASEYYDMLVLDYLVQKPSVVYINLSSGAVYGENAEKIEWENGATKTTLHLSVGGDQDFYTYAKISQEIRHRAYADLSIVDLRIFGYISEKVDLDSGFFLTELFKAKLSNRLFVTDHADFYRDFIGGDEVFMAIKSLLRLKDPINRSYDIYSVNPVKKSEILSQLNIKCSFNDDVADFFPANKRFHYYPTDRSLKDTGYAPKRTSLEVVEETLLSHTNGMSIS